MTYTIQPYTERFAQTWDDFVEHAVNGSLFHLRRFLSYHTAGRFQDASLMVYRGQRLAAVLPAAHRDQPGALPLLVSHPGATVGGIVRGRDIGAHALEDILHALVQYGREAGFGRLRIVLPPNIWAGAADDDGEFLLRKMGAVYLWQELSGVLELVGYDPDGGLRRALQKAGRENVTVRESDRFPEFYRVLRQNLAFRHNVKPTHTLQELQQLKQLFPDRIRLFGAFVNNRLAAGVVTFQCTPQTVLGFYMSHDPAWSELRVMDAVMDGSIRWARDSGFRIFDFGTYTKEMRPNWGLGRFKEKFGARGVMRSALELEL